MSVVLFWCGLMVAVLPHELGHAVAAKLVGIRILEINIGAGPLLLRVRLGNGGWLLVRSVLLGGSVRCAPSVRPRRIAEAVMLIGGAAGNVVFFFVFAFVSDAGWFSSAIMQQLAFSQLLLAGLNLIPLSLKQDGRRMPSDGAQLLALLRNRKTSMTENLLAMTRHLVPNAELDDLSDQTPRIGQLAVELFTEQEDWARRDTTASLADLLGGALTTAERTMVLSVLAEAEIRRGDTGSNWDDPERWTRDLVLISDTPTTQLLRGAALVRSGLSVEGRQLLEIALSQDILPTFAISNCLCAACAAQSGNDPLAAQFAKLRAQELAEQNGLTLNAAEFQAAVDVAPVKPRQAPLQRPGSKLTRLGLAVVIVLAGFLSLLVASDLAYRAGERRGYLVACDEKVAARMIYTARPSGVKCGQ